MNNLDNQHLNLGKDVFIGKNCIFDKIQKESKQGQFSFGDYCFIHDDCRFFISDAEFSFDSNSYL